jgi:hypothetical protein
MAALGQDGGCLLALHWMQHSAMLPSDAARLWRAVSLLRTVLGVINILDPEPGCSIGEYV